jgi:hypothetical protein
LICDQILASEIESEVFTVEGMRQRIVAASFPHYHPLSVFMRLFYARGGTFRGLLRLSHQATGDVLGEIDLRPSFGEAPGQVLLPIEIGECVFETPGRYEFAVWFWDQQGQSVQKLERPFAVVEEEAGS